MSSSMMAEEMSGVDSYAAHDDDQSENLWVDILVDVQSSSRIKLPTSKSLLVLGENETGKTTLVAKMQGVDEPKKGSGLEYMYMSIQDEYRDDQTRLGAWIVDGDLYHRGLLKFALTEQIFPHTVVLLVATLAKPWDIMDTLQRWTEVLATHINRLKLSTELHQKQKDILLRQFQEYAEPDEASGAAASAQVRRVGANPQHASAAEAVEGVVLPLGENVLTENLGIPMVVVLTKSDLISTLEKDQEFKEEHWDFIQQHVRKFCLKYGAALVYCSVKESKNCSLLYKYLLHRIYGFPFTSAACVVEKDSVFIPSGWDSEKKISILFDNMSSMKPDDYFNDVIVRPVTRKPVQRDVEVSADDEQTFLQKLQSQLAKQPQTASTSSSQRESPLPRAAGPASTPKSVISPRTPGSTSVASAMTTPKKVESSKMNSATSSDTGVLTNFFNSLLSKKTLSSSSASAEARAGTALSSDAAAELNRMAQARAAAADSAPSDSVNEIEETDSSASPSK